MLEAKVTIQRAVAFQFAGFLTDPMNVLRYHKIGVQCWMNCTVHRYNSICLLILVKHIISFFTAADSTSLSYGPFMYAIVSAYRQSIV